MTDSQIQSVLLRFTNCARENEILTVFSFANSLIQLAEVCLT